MPGGPRGLQNRCRLVNRAEVGSIPTLSAKFSDPERLEGRSGSENLLGAPRLLFEFEGKGGGRRPGSESNGNEESAREIP